MSEEFPELDNIKVTVDADTRGRHLASIATEIRRLRAPRVGRRRLLAVALAAVLLFPVAALAAESSVPGDFLYPVKRAVEPVLAVFNDDVVATHRVEEVERLFAREAPVEVLEDHLSEARAAVTDERHLSDRLDHVVDEIRKRDLRPEEDSVVTDTTHSHPVDDSTTTTLHRETATTHAPTDTVEQGDRVRDGGG